MGMIIPVVITVYADRSFSFITKTPPAAVLIKKGVQHRVRLRRPQQDQGRHHHQGLPAEDRRDQDAGSERRQRRVRHEHDCRHLPQHGRHRRAVRVHENRERQQGRSIQWEDNSE
jgi:hypothetical protein